MNDTQSLCWLLNHIFGKKKKTDFIEIHSEITIQVMPLSSMLYPICMDILVGVEQPSMGIIEACLI